MSRLLRFLALLAVLGIAVAGAAGWWIWTRLETPLPLPQEEVLFDVRSGQGGGEILQDLEARGVIADARLARAYLVYLRNDPPLQAGTYRFAAPLTTPQVLDRLIRGDVVTDPLTVIEGLTRHEIADEIARQGFGDPLLLRRAMESAALIRDLDPEAHNLEGYLYPDTYRFARGTSEAEIVATLVRTFRRRFEAEVRPLLHGDLLSGDNGAARSVRQVVTLASIVEKEARRDDERPKIAGVYANRLRRGIALYADPTVIFGLKEAGTWDGNLRRADLERDGPYNTYRNPGLPPGPICSPGVASLRAAAAPADVPYLYFVSRNDGSHVFAKTLREHNRNVERWQRQYWRRRRAENGR